MFCLVSKIEWIQIDIVIHFHYLLFNFKNTKLIFVISILFQSNANKTFALAHFYAICLAANLMESFIS